VRLGLWSIRMATARSSATRMRRSPPGALRIRGKAHGVPLTRGVGPAHLQTPDSKAEAGSRRPDSNRRPAHYDPRAVVCHWCTRASRGVCGAMAWATVGFCGCLPTAAHIRLRCYTVAVKSQSGQAQQHRLGGGRPLVRGTRHPLPPNTVLDHDRGAHETLPADRFTGRWFRGNGLTTEEERFRRKFARRREANVLDQSRGTCHNPLTWLREPAVR